jgi:type IV secretory pathway VirB9-like protein
MRRWLVGLLFILGCAHKPAIPPPLQIPDAGVSAPQSMALPSSPEPIALPSQNSGDPLGVIHRANRAALLQPTAEAFTRAIAVFPHREGTLYRIDTAVQQPTDLMLQPGERYLSFAMGEKRWKYEVSEGIDPVHLVLMPTRPGLSTRGILRTSLATYLLELRSNATTGLAAVSWKHRTRQVSVAESIAYYGVGYGVNGGDHLAWRPMYVWDDGKHSYLLFDQAMRHTMTPIVSVLHGEVSQVVNYRVKDRLFKVDRVLDAGEWFELRVDAGKDTAITVTKTPEYRFVTCPESEECRITQRWSKLFAMKAIEENEHP